LKQETDVLKRWCAIQLILSLKNQTIVQTFEPARHLISLTGDSNPIIKRLALISLVTYVKTFKQANLPSQITPQVMNDILIKLFNDPHPIVFSTAFWALCELKNRDYISYIPDKFYWFLENLGNIDEFYFERVIFSLVNMSKILLFNNLQGNLKEIQLLLKALLKVTRYSTNSNKILTAHIGILEIIKEFEKLNLNKITKDELLLFKNNQQLVKISNSLLKLYISCKTPIEKYMVLDLFLNYLNEANEKTEFLNVIKDNLIKSIDLFYLKNNDKNYIIKQKIEVLILLSSESNIKLLLSEFKRNLHIPNNNIKSSIISAIYHICKNNSTKSNSQIPSLCIENLIDMLKLKEENLISQIIICLRKLILEIKEHTKYVLIYNIKNYKKNVTSGLAKANIIWMISQYLDLIPTVAVDFFRRILIEIDNEFEEVKLQILGLAVRISAKMELILSFYPEDVRESSSVRIRNLIQYAIEKLLYDSNYLIREKSRLTKFIIDNKIFNEKCDFIQNFESIKLSSSGLINNEKKENDVSRRTYILSFLNKIASFSAEEALALGNLEKKFIFDYLDRDLVDPNISKLIFTDLMISQKTNVPTTKRQIPEFINPTQVTTSSEPAHVSTSLEKFADIDIQKEKDRLKRVMDKLFSGEDDEEGEEYDTHMEKD
jgi:vesicle coat complex subunit